MRKNALGRSVGRGGATRAAYFSEEGRIGNRVRPGEPNAKALEQESDRLLGEYDDAVEAALSAPAPDAAAMRWKLATLQRAYGDDNSWNAIDALLPKVLGEAQRFVGERA